MEACLETQELCLVWRWAYCILLNFLSVWRYDAGTHWTTAFCCCRKLHSTCKQHAEFGTFSINYLMIIPVHVTALVLFVTFVTFLLSRGIITFSTVNSAILWPLSCVWLADFLLGFQLSIISQCYSVLIFIKDLIMVLMNINEQPLILSCIIFWTHSRWSTLMNFIQQLRGSKSVPNLSEMSMAAFDSWNIICLTQLLWCLCI